MNSVIITRTEPQWYRILENNTIWIIYRVLKRNVLDNFVKKKYFAYFCWELRLSIIFTHLIFIHNIIIFSFPCYISSLSREFSIGPFNHRKCSVWRATAAHTRSLENRRITVLFRVSTSRSTIRNSSWHLAMTLRRYIYMFFFIHYSIYSVH